MRGVTALVAACVRPVVEREPQLRGSVSFRLVLASPVTVAPATGALSSLGAVSCVRSALAKVSPSAGTIDYTLTFGGAYAASPIRADSTLHSDWVGLDWSAPGAEVPAAIGQSTAALGESLRRCAFGAEPALNEILWLTLRVGKGGAVTLGPSRSSDAGTCAARALLATTFPDVGHDYAMSLVLRPNLGPVADGREKTAADSDGVQELGMIGLLNAGAGGAASAPWGRDDSMNIMGPMQGAEAGQAFGAGGLGSAGIGKGGGGRGEGIGLGTLGHGPGTGQSNGSGRLGRSPGRSPKLKMGATSVSGRLPPEVIQRIVRSNFGRFRACYEQGLKKDPKLAGRVTVTFEIGRDGSTTKASSTSELKDKSVEGCVRKGFAGLSFPQPEGGIVKVTFPIMFSPGDDKSATETTPSAPPAPRTIDGKPVASVTLSEIEQRLTNKGFTVVPVPGFTLGSAPALFVRDDTFDVYGVSLGPGREGLTGPLCTAGTPERTLYVRGEHCQRVMGPLLD